MQSETTIAAAVSENVGTAGHNHNRVADALVSEPTVRTHVVDVASASIVADPNEVAVQLAEDLRKFQKVAAQLRAELQPAATFEGRCDQLFSLANDLFANAPTWVCFFREVLATEGVARVLFPKQDEYDRFMASTHYHQVEQMLTALRSRDLPENDPNDPQRMITVRLPKSLHEALCHEAGRLNISVNKLCISRLLQILDRKMIPETVSKPRGRKPRTHVKAEAAVSQPATLG